MKALTSKEQEIFELICKNPQISQDELAKVLNITRSSVSVHISNLLKKRYIEGKGYIINRKDKVVVIGASMIDIVGRSFDPLLSHDSNPGKIKVSAGGVSRNISENLSRIGCNVSLISAICDDSFGQVIKESCYKANIDISDSYILADSVTTSYLAILNNEGDMNLALSDTTALDEMPVSHLVDKSHVLKSARVIVVDAALPRDVMDYILENFKDIPIFLDPVSIGKAKSIKNKLTKFHTIKCNKLEAEFLSGISINNDDDIIEVSDYFSKLGVSQVFITLGPEGVYYKTATDKGFYRGPVIQVENATGAGDAFMAGLVYGFLKEYDTKDTVVFSHAMSSLALQANTTVNTNITASKVIQEMEKANNE